MPDISLPQALINGNRHDYSSIEFIIDGKRIVATKEINYSQTLKGAKLYGTSAAPIGRTRGKLEAEGSISIYKSEAAQLQADLGDGWMEKRFDIAVIFGEAGIFNTDILKDVRLSKSESGHSEGEDPLVTKFDLDPMYIIENGRTPLYRMNK